MKNKIQFSRSPSFKAITSCTTQFDLFYNKADIRSQFFARSKSELSFKANENQTIRVKLFENEINFRPQNSAGENEMIWHLWGL